MTYEQVILAHQCCCPYHSPKAELEGLPQPQSCGAADLHHQTDCNGECWYMSHFKQLLKELQEEAD